MFKYTGVARKSRDGFDSPEGITVTVYADIEEDAYVNLLPSLEYLPDPLYWSVVWTDISQVISDDLPN